MFMISMKGCVSLGARREGSIQLFEAAKGVNFGTRFFASAIHFVALKSKNSPASLALTKTGVHTRRDSSLIAAVIMPHTFDGQCTATAFFFCSFVGFIVG